MDRKIFWFRVSVRRVCRACGRRAVEVLYQTASNADKRAARAVSQARENRSYNFFTFVTRTMQGEHPSAEDHL